MAAAACAEEYVYHNRAYTGCRRLLLCNSINQLVSRNKFNYFWSISMYRRTVADKRQTKHNTIYYIE